MSRLGPSLRRWIEIFGYSAIGALVAIPLGTLVAQTTEDLAEATFAGTTPKLLFSVVLCLSIVAVLWRYSGTRLLHWRHLITYPPLGVAIPVSIWMVIGLLSTTSPATLKPSEIPFLKDAFFVVAITTTALTIATAIIMAGYSSIRKAAFRHEIRKRHIISKDLFSVPLPELLDWLSSEIPITRSAEDMFGSDERARRVAKALQTERRSGDDRTLRQTVVIQGPFGSGKSSVVALAQDYLLADESENFIFVSVQCWGFSSIAAQEYLLEKAVAELSKEVDCLSLRSIPSAYVDAVTETNTWIGACYRALAPNATPLDHIKRFTPILEAINSRLVVIIEDTDRNGPDFDQKHIEAMLFNFREVERISFVLTAGSKSEIEFPKIAEHILFLPLLPEGSVLTLLDRVRHQCRIAVPFNDPTPSANRPRNRPDSLSAEAATVREASAAFSRTVPSWPRSLASLLNTPRKLKQTLSAIVNQWETLRGEVDIDELIMVTALRTCAPGVYTFFGSHFHDLKPLFRHRDKQPNPDEEARHKDRIEFIRRQWGKVVEESGHDPVVLGTIVSELIPSLAALTGVTAWAHGNRCQSIGSNRGATYWERLTTESLSDRELRDQDVLTVLAGATTEEGATTLGKRAGKSRDFAELVSFFRRFSRNAVDDDHLLQALAVALNHVRPFERSWLSENVSSYESVIKWIETISVNEQVLRDWLSKQLEACLPQHLQDANYLYHDIQKRISRDCCQVVRMRLLGHCQRAFGAMSPQEFSACFDGNFPYTLAHLVRSEKTKSEALLTRAEDWRWLSPLLLESMEAFPETIVPQVMMLFGDYGTGEEGPTYFDFDEGELRSLFGDELPRALKLLTHTLIIPETMEGLFRLAAPLGTQKAKDWLNGITKDGDAQALPSI